MRGSVVSYITSSITIQLEGSVRVQKRGAYRRGLGFRVSHQGRAVYGL